jgi:GNAT superfamily N-acetyltransferase
MTDFERKRGTFTITTDVARIDVDAVHAYLSRSYWATNIPREIVARSIAGSLNFALLDGAATIGLARIVSDGATFAYLCDVYVLEPYRGQGLGKWVMQELLSHPRLQGLRRFILATRDAHGLYSRFGFTALVSPGAHMELARPNFYQPSPSPTVGP